MGITPCKYSAPRIKLDYRTRNQRQHQPRLNPTAETNIGARHAHGAAWRGRGDLSGSQLHDKQPQSRLTREPHGLSPACQRPFRRFRLSVRTVPRTIWLVDGDGVNAAANDYRRCIKRAFVRIQRSFQPKATSKFLFDLTEGYGYLTTWRVDWDFATPPQTPRYAQCLHWQLLTAPRAIGTLPGRFACP